MKKELKQVIVKYIFDNYTTFNLHNLTKEEFREYIYTGKGEYLIGGDEVAEFINQAIKLLTK